MCACRLAEVYNQVGRLLNTTSGVVDFLLQLVSFVTQAHAAQLVCGDIKPANLMLSACPDGHHLTLRICDLGTCKRRRGPADRG